MTLPSKTDDIAALRSVIVERFGGAALPEGGQSLRGTPLGSGWDVVDDALLGGGLAPGETALIDAVAGAGALALASSWARQASRLGEPVAVLDVGGCSLPHPWIEPPGARAPIWVVTLTERRQCWPAIDMALRSGAFGMVLLLDAAAPPRGIGARLLSLVRQRETRLVVSGALPFSPTVRIRMRLERIHWDESPVGKLPARRQLSVSCSPGRGAVSGFSEVMRADHLTDRLHPRARIADRRPAPRKKS